MKIHRYDPRDIEAFQDPIWRISNLYSIRIRDGSVIRFRPRPQQLAVLEMLFVHGHKRIIILKARQIGFSTLLGVVCCDQLCFNPGQQISLIDQTLEDARQKLKNIVVLAYDSMAAELRAGLPIIRSNTGEVCVKYSRFEEAKASVMYAGTHSRGGSNSLLWVSEWGTIQATDIARSEEILTGALPSVGDGICVIESTWRGGRHGHLWGLVKQALETPEEQKGPFDWRLAFFPWYEDPGYCDALPRPLSVETRRYFEGKPGLSVNPGQNELVPAQARRVGYVHPARISEHARGVFSKPG